jgi:hypothetical protein
LSNSFKDYLLAAPENYSVETYKTLRQQLITIECVYSKEAPKFEHLFDRIASAHEHLGLIAYFVRRDWLAFKKHWHILSRISVLASRHEPDSDNYITGGSMSRERDLLYAFISDSPLAISEVVALDTPRLRRWRDTPKAAEFSFHLAQLAMRGDEEEIEEKIAVGAKKAGGHLKESYAKNTDFYSLLMRGDKAGLEASIMDCTKAEQKHTMIICDFIRPLSTFRTNLCWYKGIPVEIEHPMMPMDWMPIAPLAHYEDVYDFLSPAWTPPDQSLFARVARKFQKDFPNVDACMDRIRRIDAGATSE